MLKHKALTIVFQPIQIGSSFYMPIPKKKVLVGKGKSYILSGEISEVEK